MESTILPTLLMAYLFLTGRKKSNSELAPFDPSAHYVHPKSRPLRKIRLSVNGGSTSRSAQHDESEAVPDSEAENETDGSSERNDDEDYSEASTKSTYRIKTRYSNKKELPFSPRKSRSRKILPVSDSEGNENEADRNEDETRHGVRRSTRTKKAAEVRLDFDDEEYTDDEYDVSKDRRSKSSGKAKHKKRVKSAQPMYGHFRSIDTLDQDPFSDDEDNEALRRHRDICEKCHLAPAHKLLAAFKKKSKGKGKKRKRSTDDEFEQSESEQTFVDLGGWVQWYVFTLPERRFFVESLSVVSSAPLVLIGNVWRVTSMMRS